MVKSGHKPKKEPKSGQVLPSPPVQSSLNPQAALFKAITKPCSLEVNVSQSDSCETLPLKGKKKKARKVKKNPNTPSPDEKLCTQMPISQVKDSLVKEQYFDEEVEAISISEELIQLLEEERLEKVNTRISRAKEVRKKLTGTGPPTDESTPRGRCRCFPRHRASM